MFKNSNGELVPKETCIFPLITFNPKSKEFKCLGTGFFIHPFGGFVTAKHVFFDNKGNHVPTLYAVQSLADGTRVVRTLKHLVTHPEADIAIGMLGDAVNNANFNKNPVPASAFQLSFNTLEIGDQVSTYAFPSTQSAWLDDNHQEFTFQGNWSKGEVKGFHPEGFLSLKNACYETSMRIDGGASGGPVMKDAVVVGVNSTGMIFEKDAISAITPVSFLKDLEVPYKDEMISVVEMAKKGWITIV